MGKTKTTVLFSVYPKVTCAQMMAMCWKLHKLISGCFGHWGRELPCHQPALLQTWRFTSWICARTKFSQKRSEMLWMSCLTSLKIVSVAAARKLWNGALRNISTNAFPPFACDSHFDTTADTSAHLQLQRSAMPAQQWLTCSLCNN